MSRIRTTLDSVTKAVGSTDLISKFSRLKPGSSVADGAHAEKVLVRAERVASKEREAPLPPGAAVGDADGGKGGSEDDQKGEPVSENPFVATKNPEASAPVSSFNQTPQVYHPTNMDETYKTLAQHINSYFGMGTTQGGGGDCNPRPDSNIIPRKSPDRIPVLSPAAASESVDTPASSHPSVDLSPPEAKAPPDTPATESTTAAVPVLTASPKKGFTHYLSYPRPSVQAFVGNYIAPLVPKFRGDAQSVERDKLPAENGAEASVEKIESEDHVDESKQQLLAQREKIIARVSVDNRTRALVKGLHRVNDVQLLTSRVEELSCHLLEFPETRGVAVKEKAIPCLLRLRQATDLRLQAAVRESLALVGYTEPVKGRGIRVLAIDGGGTRGLLALQTLLKLENLTGKRVHQLFDYICGVSTGAILAFMLGIFQIPLEECEQMYRKLGSDVFKQNVIVGAVKMGWSHAFYDSEIWESILKERMGEGCMIESSRDPNCPKVSAVSTLVNRGLPLKAFVFRNYRLLPGVRSHYLGDCKYKMWQAIRASSAAPGYFPEYVLGKDLHQDGGLLINNPTALAIHECKCLWPNTPLQCVLSLGTGRHEVAGKNGTTYTSLKDKLTNVISSATDTEEVHTMLDALLPPDAYFRFNPYLSEDVPLNESRVDKLNFLMGEGERYLERNDAKLRKAAGVLSQEKGAIQRLAEWAKLKAEMYEGPPFTSKL
ncbi:calcium-independent phospholipase A2-gamma [Syngnathoides biaculeatus]|uniref:calcium-independent phospholipase A2-gamma n=1 Tax=Syngnathoides biaculeatus TaxID=300417 RepID=UPI002ADD7AAE|nr:calcium-independent phospholipase A2-gamma [Syngnathoides biaculeatus]XP_061663279.1 calcium-independent phospholipase A2-gamma [Syngnathoides biaculeatus]XP_061663280.1 calcium-independent phospholipase A2-gamma [Syngnathoides biaculeatus]XP_061663281.1 calcium-independent phospholipase A2-gamma [Syngnathoides biaculeatus]